MNFKIWLNEVAEPIKPSSRVVRSNIVKDAGTNVAKPSIQFRWKTKLGNVIKLQFDHNGPDSYNVMFYVNDTLYDDSPKVENGRDPEILSNVFYLLKQKADAIGAKSLSFQAYSSGGDIKIIRGINPEPYKAKVLNLLDELEKKILSYVPKMIPPSQRKIDLWAKLGREMPESNMDFDPTLRIKWIRKLREAIINNENLYDHVNTLKTAIGLKTYNVLDFDMQSLEKAIEELYQSQLSNTGQGWGKTRNRRAAIYSKLLDRYFTDEWNIEKDNDRFYLTRKNT